MLTIAFDAKRAFSNSSGLGNYSRDIIRGLKRTFPENRYILFSPQQKTSLLEDKYTQNTVSPKGIYSLLKPLWRSYGITADIKNQKPDIFHGLSNELPFNILKASCRKVVTIHDVIFLKYPAYYKATDRFIYRHKTSHACRTADLILATSQCTKEDILHFFPKLNPDKIQVAYQGCHPAFYTVYDDESKNKIRIKYRLPNRFILCVGTIEPRKNFLSVLKAIGESKIDMPLVLAGRATNHLREIQSYAVRHKREKQLWILHNVSNSDMPLLYQMADLFVFPSHYEGFGIPVLEAFNSGTPVVTTNYGSLAEIADNAAVLINPNNTEALGNAILEILNNKDLAKSFVEKGYKRALNFRQEMVLNRVMDLYKTIM